MPLALRPLLTPLAAAVVLLLPGSRAAAQSSPGAYTQGEINNDVVSCSYSAGPTMDERGCGSGSASTRVLGQVDAAGALHAGAWVSYQSSFPVYWHASALAGFTDRLTFDGVIPDYLEVTTSLHGRASGLVFNSLRFTAADPLLERGHRTYIGGSDLSKDWTYLEDTFRVRPVGGVLHYGLELFVGLQMSAAQCPVDADACGDGSHPGTYESFVDFSNTARIVGMRGFDQAGNDVTSAMQARSAMGYTFDGAAPVSTVPEPATLGLVGLGLAGTVVVARRRRR